MSKSELKMLVANPCVTPNLILEASIKTNTIQYLIFLQCTNNVVVSSVPQYLGALVSTLATFCEYNLFRLKSN